MDLAFSPEDLAFQQEVRDWIATAYDDDLRRKAAQSKNGYLDKAGQVKWQKKLYERGWAALTGRSSWAGRASRRRSATSSTWSCRWPARPTHRRWG